MSDSEKPAPNQTIQLDALDPAEAERLVASPSSPPGEGMPARRKTPPPLPPSALVMSPPAEGADAAQAGAASPEAGAPVAAVSRAPRAPSVVPPPPRSPAQKAGMAVAFVVLVVGAIAGGLYVGGSARGKITKESAAATPSAAAPAPSASDNVLMLPTIEMGSTKQQ